jgi:hypothetical protein
MTLFKYLQERIRTRRGKVPAAFNLATARCEAAYPSKVVTWGTSFIPHCQGEEPLGCSHVTPLA